MLTVHQKIYLVRKSSCGEFQTLKTSIVADSSQEQREWGVITSLEGFCDPEALQAVDNEKISILITSYKAAVIPSNNPIGIRPCHCQTAECTIVFLHQPRPHLQPKVKTMEHFERTHDGWKLLYK